MKEHSMSYFDSQVKQHSKVRLFLIYSCVININFLLSLQSVNIGPSSKCLTSRHRKEIPASCKC